MHVPKCPCGCRCGINGSGWARPAHNPCPQAASSTCNAFVQYYFLHSHGRHGAQEECHRALSLTSSNSTMLTIIASMLANASNLCIQIQACAQEEEVGKHNPSAWPSWTNGTILAPMLEHAFDPSKIAAFTRSVQERVACERGCQFCRWGSPDRQLAKGSHDTNHEFEKLQE